MEKEYALITGASKGLGKSFALELSKLNINLILVGLPNEGLREIISEINTSDIDVQIHETDLTLEHNVIEMTKWANANFKIFMLINNAGIGGSKEFIDADISYLSKIIQLNVLALTLITRALLPNLLLRPKSYILNVSSMAAFSPIGYKTVYPASKAFVHHFTRGLNQELKDTNVFVSVVNPGPMKTNEEVIKRITNHGALAKIGLLSPDKVAAISIRQLLKRDDMIMLNFGNGLSWLLMKIIPIWIRLPLMTRAVKKELLLEKIIAT
ncbi:MAG TPA: SDR family NAD(P)-dependent oxidoreductase [Bacteroidia bacterium]|nr:SDR family NAD(P)-dependent oxidoreductase [Bacteroidia bacterium]